MNISSASSGKPALRSLPGVDELVRSETGRELLSNAGTKRLTELSRQVIAEIRHEIGADDLSGLRTKPELLAEAEKRLLEKWQRSLNAGIRCLINATGVVIHTNLGRAPLSDTAIEKLVEAAGYCNLEYDLETGLRGKRGARVETLLCELTGAEDALVVNNCAAAAFFVLSVFASGREVIISRGELVEIGGDFRIPDVLTRSGVTLREVGTTNRTKLSDYESALSEKTALILSVHTSNYRIVGFTASPSLSELAELAHKRNILCYEDAGSGAVTDLNSIGLEDEPRIGDSVAAGADIVTFSGDKLLGGPQAGLIVGRRELIHRLRRDPLYRALRVDKLALAAMEATLEIHARGRSSDEIPVLKMLTADRSEIEQRCWLLIEKLTNPNISAELSVGSSAVGGGAAPLVQPETALIVLKHSELSAQELEARLRNSATPVITRIVDDKVAIDLRTVANVDDDELLAMLNAA